MQTSTPIKRGRLTLIEMVELRRPRSKSLWKCVCDCGNIIVKPYKNTYLGQSCGCISKEIHIKNRKGESVTINHCYRSHKANAISRELKPLSKNDWSKIAFRECYYCGDIDVRSYSNKTHIPAIKVQINGIDRLDSTIGYELGNVVPCCERCNIMKMDRNETAFLSHLQKIHNHLKL